MSTRDISIRLDFQKDDLSPFVARFKLSNWKSDVWRIEEGRLLQTKDRLAEIRERRARVLEVYGEPHSWIRIQNAPWPALGIGDPTWTDYSAEVLIEPTGGGRCGIAFRWEDARHYYALLLEEGRRIVLYRREHDEFHLLAEAEFPHWKEDLFRLRAVVTRSRIECNVENGPSLMVDDAGYSAGGVALIADSPAAYHSLVVEGTAEEREPPTINASIAPREEARIPLREFPPSHRGTFRFLPILGRPFLFVYFPSEQALQCFDHQGEPRYELGPWNRRLGSGGDLPFQVFDLDGDGKDELVIIADYRLCVHDALTGALKKSVPAPSSHHYGEGARHTEERLGGDALCPVRLAADGEQGVYVKDRYWNLWLYDSSLNLLWTHARNTGHFPLPVDVDGDGRDEILCGPALLDCLGNVIWELRLDDHFDSIGHLALSPDLGPQFYVMAGEEGTLRIDPKSGRLAKQLRWGHMQSFAVGRFLPGVNEHQMLCSTLWREPGIFYLVDGHMRERARWQSRETHLGSGWPLPWGDRDLILIRGSIYDPMTGDQLVRVAVEHTAAWVMDWPGVGSSRIVTAQGDEIVIYGPASGSVREDFPLSRAYSSYLPKGTIAPIGGV